MRVCLFPQPLSPTELNPKRVKATLTPGIPKVVSSLLPLLVSVSWCLGFPPAASTRLSVPLIKQPYKMCLVTSVSMVLRYWGLEISPAEIAREVPVYKEGTTGLDLQHFVESRGFQGFLIQPELEDLFSHLAKGHPLIVTLPGRKGVDHALVLVGHDESTVWLNDPATGKEISRSLQSFARRWRENQRWTFLILPNRIPS